MINDQQTSNSRPESLRLIGELADATSTITRYLGTIGPDADDFHDLKIIIMELRLLADYINRP